MLTLPSSVLSSGLIGAGALAWVLAGRPLTSNPDLDAPLNPLGINRSPYGEVIAMAMQGPIDTYFDAGMSSDTHPTGDVDDCEDHAAANPEANKIEPGKTTLNNRLGALLRSLDKVSRDRTNPKAASEALRRHVRRQAEDRLRFAYQLDPAHYGNYNALHFFLTEPAVGTRPELTPSAAKLADDTIHYCLKQDQDPRPALTAAAAATNILHLMFSDHREASPKYSTDQMRQYLALLDYCLARFARISEEWTQSKQWDLLSPMRIAECQERYQFICKVRDAAEKTILHIEAESLTPQTSSKIDSSSPREDEESRARHAS